MTNQDDDIQIILSDQVKEQMKNDPKLAKDLREFFAVTRQAIYGVQTGKYDSFDQAMEAITGVRPEKIECPEIEDDDDD